jgi:hypothetical protein
VTYISLDYTLTEEEEGENISDNKELREEEDTYDETNSKIPKVPFQPLNPTELENPAPSMKSIQKEATTTPRKGTTCLSASPYLVSRPSPRIVTR